MPSETVEAQGHLIDSGDLQAILTTIVENNATYEILRFEVGRTNDDPSRLTIRVAADRDDSLENLLENAWKYTARTRDAKVQFGWEWKAGQAIYFVRDNGIGFDVTKAGNLFKPFVRLHSSTEYPGTGIGLSIALRAIHRHGGQIWVESRPDQGTTFFFRL